MGEGISLWMRTVDEPQQPEIGRRIRAAMAYSGISREAAADAMSVSTSHLDRFTARKASGYAPTWTQVWKLADACELPREFFLLLSLVTVGLWIPVWVCIGAFGGEKRIMLSEDADGVFWRRA